MTENFTTSSKGSETSKNSEKYSLELNVNNISKIGKIFSYRIAPN